MTGVAVAVINVAANWMVQIAQSDVLLEKAIELPMQRGAMFVGDLVVLCAPADGASVGVNV